MRRSGKLLFVALACAGMIPACFAESYAVHPSLALSSDQYHILASYKEYADGSIQGDGSRLQISYDSSIPLDAYIAIQNEDGSYNPADLYHFSLVAGQNETATVELTALPTWLPGTHHYYLGFLSNSTHTDTHFTNMSFVPGSASDIFAASWNGFSQIEPYWVSSAHLLRGYTILDTSFATILGICMLLISGLLLLWKKRNATTSIMCVMLIVIGIYSARVLTDFTVWSVDHLQQWTAQHEYGEAQDLYAAAELVQERAKTVAHPAVSVCFDSTDYYAKLLRYLVYPIPVSLTGALLPATSQVLVTHKINWSYQNGVLQCGSINAPAVLMKDFPDGSHLYSINQHT